MCNGEPPREPQRQFHGWSTQCVHTYVLAGNYNDQHLGAKGWRKKSHLFSHCTCTYTHTHALINSHLLSLRREMDAGSLRAALKLIHRESCSQRESNEDPFYLSKYYIRNFIVKCRTRHRNCADDEMKI